MSVEARWQCRLIGHTLAATKIKDVTAEGLTTATGPDPMEVGLVSRPAQHFQQSEWLPAAVKESPETASSPRSSTRCSLRRQDALAVSNGMPARRQWDTAAADVG
jgi:hypothetical protein